MKAQPIASKLVDQGWLNTIDKPFQFEKLKCPDCQSKNITAWPDSTGFIEIVMCNDCGARVKKENPKKVQ